MQNHNNQLIQVLNVAEKPSVAKEVSRLLSNSQYQNIRSSSKFNPIHVFDYTLMNQKVKMIFTSVSGHIMGYKFDQQFNSWSKFDPAVLLTTDQLNKQINQDKVEVVKNIETQAINSQVLILWLDCDREGEAIAFEVIEICKNKNRNLEIYRAHFSAVTKVDINRAINNLKDPDKYQSDAVEARQIIDLRIGACYTRYQTLILKNTFNSLQNVKMISYGPCQFPTLGFVVERYKKIRDFISEPFWHINCKYNWTDNFNQKKITKFEWKRQKLFDQYTAALLYEKCIFDLNNNQIHEVKAKVIKLDEKPKSKWKPYPLATIQLQKLGTQKLRMSSHQVMDVAEKLYTKGFISYPRTETDQFPNTMNMQQLLEVQRQHPIWGNYVVKLLDENKFQTPKRGQHDDKAHPPIHPVKIYNQGGEGNFTQDEWKVYELITRHFLACCSIDAKGQETYMEIQIDEEIFHAKGLAITELNYLEIYIYDKWSESEVPNLSLDQTFALSEFTLEQGKTGPPNLLTETELITLMDKNGIGTDATIHEHIKTIQERQYAIKNNQYFKPTSLGVALVEAYENLGFTLSQPHLRALMEQKMTEISKGRLFKDQVIEEIMQMMIEIYQKLKLNQNLFVQKVGQFLQDEQNIQENIGGQDGQWGNGGGQPGQSGQSGFGRQQQNQNGNNNINRQHNVVNGSNNSSFSRDNNNNENYNSINTHNNQSNGIQRSTSNDQQATQICFKCKQPGHYANKCPSNGLNSIPQQDQEQRNRFGQGQTIQNKQLSNNFTSASNLNNNNQVNKTQQRCFKCQEPGHFANACPNKQNTNFQNKPSNMLTNQQNLNNQNKNTQLCFKCQQPGHYANNCPGLNNNNKTNVVVNNKHQSSFIKKPEQQQNQEELQQQKKQRKYIPCSICGKCRHVKGSNCPGQKKKNKKDSKQKDTEDNEFEQEDNFENSDQDNDQ